MRLDSFVYTVEGLREARARLKPGGMISLSFTILNRDMGRKIYLMMQQAFDGRPPVCIMTGYDWSTIFLEANDKDVGLPSQLLQQTGFQTRHRSSPIPSCEPTSPLMTGRFSTCRDGCIRSRTWSWSS